MSQEHESLKEMVLKGVKCHTEQSDECGDCPYLNFPLCLDALINDVNILFSHYDGKESNERGTDSVESETEQSR